LSTLHRIMVAVALVVVISGAAYSLGLFNRPPKAAFAYRTPTRTLKYIAPTDRDLIIFTNESTDPETPLEKLISNWYVRYNGTGDWKHLNSSTHHWGRLPLSNDKGHEVKLIVSDGVKEDSTVVVLLVDPGNMPEYGNEKLDIPIKGISYLVGRQFLYSPTFRDELELREQLDVIKNELRCNALKIYGDYEDWLVRSAEIAIDKGFETIAVAPLYRMANKTAEIDIEENIRRVAALSKRVEELRLKSDRILLMLPCELSLEVIGIRSGTTYADRQKQLSSQWRSQEIFNRLNFYLDKMTNEVRKNYHGQITYGKLAGGDQGGGCEKVDWNRLGLDIVGAQEYWNKRYFSREQVLKTLLDLKPYGKPIWITEFGCCSYEGASQYGGAGGDYVYLNTNYDEREQARHIADQIGIYKAAKMDGIFLHAFCAGHWTTGNRYFGVMRALGDKMPIRRKLGFYAYQSYIVAA